MIIKHRIHFLIVFCCCVFSVQAQKLYYYHRGDSVSLSVNSQHFLVYAEAGKISMDELNREFKITESIETGQNGIIEVQVNFPNVNYDSVVNVLKAKEYIIDIEPVIGNSVLYNTSRLFYVKLHTHQDYSLLSLMASRTGAEIRGEVPFCENWYELCVNKNSTGNSIETANQFWESQYFSDIDPGFILHFGPISNTACVSDSRFDEQWGMQAIKACSAWKITKGDTNVRIAVIDRGIDVNHKEFDSTNVAFSYDAEANSSPAKVYNNNDKLFPGFPEPFVYHGIHVGGIIFANHNRYSEAGVAPKSSLINISTCFKNNDSMSIKLAMSFNQAVANDAQVISNSWGDNTYGEDTNMYSALLENAIDNAIDNQIVVVFSVGNAGYFEFITYPAYYREEILAVGAIQKNKKQSGYSNCDIGLDIMAPGDSILSTHNDNGYCYMSGTSMAAPHVSGVAGLMLSINPNLTGQDVRDIIEQTAQKVHSDIYHYYNTVGKPNGTWYRNMGYGLLDAHRAVLKAAYHKVYGDTALTFCDTSCHPYTVRAPHNANIDSVSFFWTCSDNLQMVAGQNTDSVWVKFTNSGKGQLQCHIVHDGDTVTSTLDISNMSGRTMYDNLTLNSSLSYPDTFVLSREVVVDSLTMLTWQDKTVLCTPDCRLIVRPRGFLTLDHTTLTSACPGEMWQGIEVVGDRTKRQIAQYQGTVELRNGAVIKNAHCGIRTGLREDTLTFATTGGIILADSAFFVNNRRSIEINTYKYYTPSGNVANYVSSISRCTFTVDDGNLFAANNTSFSEHVKLWDVRKISISGCTFDNQTSGNTNKGRGIYAYDAGVVVQTYCPRPLFVYECECPSNIATYGSFSGFNTAVDVNTSGNPYEVTVNQTRFSNNVVGLEINANDYVTVTQDTFDLQSALNSSTNLGLVLDNCTGYKVEGNRFHKSSKSFNLTSTGILVNNSGVTNNSIYRNVFDTLDYGIRVTGINGNTGGGLQMTAGSFTNTTNDIHIAKGALVSPWQGTPRKGADNAFVGSATYNIYNAGLGTITYYHSSNSNYLPNSVSTKVIVNGSAGTNPKTSTLCDPGWHPPFPLAGFQSGMNEYTTALAQVGDADGTGIQQGGNETLTDMRQSLSDTYCEAVRTLMSDTVLDINELEQWHTAAQSANLANYANIGDPYSLMETRFMEGYAETFAGDAEDAEMANYAEFHALKLALRDNVAANDVAVGTNDYSPLQPGGHINWYALTPAQIAQLQTIAERNTGRASVMAKGVLCFFHGICYEDEWDDAGVFDTPLQDGDTMATRAKHTPMDTDNDATLSVYPNPTEDILFVELRGGAGIANMALYDLQGRVVGTRFIASATGASATMNMRDIPAGVYVLRVMDADGKEYHRKIVRK